MWGSEKHARGRAEGPKSNSKKGHNYVRKKGTIMSGGHNYVRNWKSEVQEVVND
jgi:hypothetical protein